MNRCASTTFFFLNQNSKVMNDKNALSKKNTRARLESTHADIFCSQFMQEENKYVRRYNLRKMHYRS